MEVGVLSVVNTNWHKLLWHIHFIGLFYIFLLLARESDTSGNSFKSVTFINHFPLFRLWCMKAFTLVRFQKYLKLMSPISWFEIYYEMLSWEHSHLCPVSSFWSSGVPEWRNELFISLSYLFIKMPFTLLGLVGIINTCISLFKILSWYACQNVYL